SLTLEQKISQMIIVHGGMWNLDNWKKMQLGGIHLFALKDEQLFKNTIDEFMQNMSIPFLVTVDLEGCWSPFANFKNFTAVSEISTPEEAANKGAEEGRFLKKLGFTVNFAPVIDLKDDIWKCRSFPGDEQDVTRLAEAYVDSVQDQGIIATAKHYPGKTLMIKDPHKFIVTAEVSPADVYPFKILSKKNKVKAIMVSHIISSGAVDSEGMPAVVSKAALAELKNNFSGMVISDEINMLGLKKYYSSLDELYVAVFAAGNDLIINFNDDPNEIHHMIKVVKAAIDKGEVAEAQINNSVRRILELKGFKVV
ncbi:hypothetical protein HZC32_03785, partial [Candidatus Woesearchaeota archaeon]|nr:hypothetical protein [Candidatus Woesearchaeota archaeon]